MGFSSGESSPTCRCGADRAEEHSLDLHLLFDITLFVHPSSACAASSTRPRLQAENRCNICFSRRRRRNVTPGQEKWCYLTSLTATWLPFRAVGEESQEGGRKEEPSGERFTSLFILSVNLHHIVGISYPVCFIQTLLSKSYSCYHVCLSTSLPSNSFFCFAYLLLPCWVSMRQCCRQWCTATGLTTPRSLAWTSG